MCYLVRPSSGVVQKQKHRVVPAAESSAAVRFFQQRIQLILFQIAHQTARDLLRLDGLNLSAPVEVLWAIQADKACQGPDGREALISRRDPTAARHFHVLKECSRASQRQVSDLEPIEPSVGTAGNKRQELLQCVPIALLRVACEIPLDNEIFQQESADPVAQ